MSKFVNLLTFLPELLMDTKWHGIFLVYHLQLPLYLFQSLVQFVKERSLETGLQSTKLGPRHGTEARGVLDKVKKEMNR